MLRALKALTLGVLALTSTAIQADVDHHIVTSIKPLGLLVRAIAPDSVNVTTLVPAGSSPHTYQMRPSQRRALEQADLVVWIGPDMETFLIRMLSGEDFSSRTLTLMADGDPAEHDHDHDHASHDDHGHHDDHAPDHEPSHHDHGEDHAEHESHDRHSGHDHHDHSHGEDPHTWLDPQLGLAMAEQLRDRLATLPGIDSEQLDRNLARFRIALTGAERRIQQQLIPAREISLFTYHDAFRHFAEHYNLAIAGILTLNPERSPGARHIAEVQEQLRASTQPCLLTEPQFNQQWWRSITEGMDLRFSTWDPLASEIPDTADGYIQFQQSMADAVLACLPE